MHRNVTDWNHLAVMMINLSLKPQHGIVMSSWFYFTLILGVRKPQIRHLWRRKWTGETNKSWQRIQNMIYKIYISIQFTLNFVFLVPWKQRCCRRHPSWKLCRAVFYNIYVTEVLVASNIRAISTSETSVTFYQTTRRYNSEDSHLHTRHRENMKFT
jgi:hypothetical protein